MHIHPAIAALRSDRASQPTAQARMVRTAQDWRATDQVQEIARDLAAFAAGEPLDQCPGLAALLSDHAAALAIGQPFLSSFVSVVRQTPLGEVPFPHRHSGGYSTIRLLTFGSASLSLSAYARRDAPIPPASAVFVDREAVEIVLNGTARGMSHRLCEGGSVGRVVTTGRSWREGDRITISASQSRQFVEVGGSLLMLQLTRVPKCPGPTREYRLSDSALVKSASGNKTASREMMALGVLGALKSRAALGVMKRIVQDRSREPDLRWEAMRQLLALDSARGFALLGTLAKRSADPLALPSASLRNQLAAAYPQLVVA